MVFIYYNGDVRFVQDGLKFDNCLKIANSVNEGINEACKYLKGNGRWESYKRDRKIEEITLERILDGVSRDSSKRDVLSKFLRLQKIVGINNELTGQPDYMQGLATFLFYFSFVEKVDKLYFNGKKRKIENPQDEQTYLQNLSKGVLKIFSESFEFISRREIGNFLRNTQGEMADLKGRITPLRARQIASGRVCPPSVLKFVKMIGKSGLDGKFPDTGRVYGAMSQIAREYYRDRVKEITQQLRTRYNPETNIDGLVDLSD